MVKTLKRTKKMNNMRLLHQQMKEKINKVDKLLPFIKDNPYYNDLNNFITVLKQKTQKFGDELEEQELCSLLTKI